LFVIKQAAVLVRLIMLQRGVRKMELCRSSYVILGILRAVNATDSIHGLTVSEIHGFERRSKHNTVHKKIKGLESNGLICEGVKAGRAKTYYLTDSALRLLPEKQQKHESGENTL
jgi:hypothetical protein